MYEGDYTSRASTVTPVNGTLAVLASDPRRVSLLVSWLNVANGAVLSLPDVPNGPGLILLGATTPLLLSVHEMGPVVGGRFNIQSGAAQGSVMFIEVLKLGGG